MKIDIFEYRKPMEEYILQTSNISITQLSAVMEVMYEFINSHLICKHCGKALLDECFSKSKQHKNRRKRYPVCKICDKEYKGYGNS